MIFGNDDLAWSSDEEEILPQPEAHAPAPTVYTEQPKPKTKKWVVVDNSDVSNFGELEHPITFPFELDAFQKRACMRVNNKEHVMVSAHTSAGKTVIAEYAVAHAIANGSIAIYTSPIKALSNQKFREFSSKFDSVGIITGDVSVNPDASCLIVTTEILRNMIYKNHPVISSIQSVILDECHYVNDPDRGVVWEEVIIMLPDHVDLVLLSATVPNYLDFADWIGRTKQREVYAVRTDHRPTPLKHFMWINEDRYLLMSANGLFNNSAYDTFYSKQRAKKKEKEDRLALEGKKDTKKFNKTDVTSNEAQEKTEGQRLQGQLRTLQSEGELPVVVFCFSRMRCETLAHRMTSLSVVTDQERWKIDRFVEDSIQTLSDEDKQLPQILNTRSLVERGIGIHHGGLLPLVKEMVEILFSRGLVKVLFATETFAMGVNMPAKSVIFTSIRKHDGIKMRTLYSSEYTQMAGRAGRRGLDEYGNVFIFCSDTPPENKELVSMMLEKAMPLQSKFKVTFQMVLQLAVSQEKRLEEVMGSSFMETIRSANLPLYQMRLKKRQLEYSTMSEVQCIYGEPTIESYIITDNLVKTASTDLHMELYKHKAGPKVLAPGRCVQVGGFSFLATQCLGVLTETKGPLFTILILLPEEVRPKGLGKVKLDAGAKLITQGELRATRQWMLVEDVPLDRLTIILDHVTKSKITDNKDEMQLQVMAQELDVYISSLKGKSMPPLPLKKNFKSVEQKFFEAILRQRDLLHELEQNKCHECPLREEHYVQGSLRQKCLKDIEQITHLLKDESLDLYEVMCAKHSVLKARGFMDLKGAVTLKGRVACEILGGDELTLGEVIFEGLLKDLDECEIASVLSGFVLPEKYEEVPLGPTPAVANARSRIEEIHGEIGKLMSTMGCKYNQDEWWRLCNFRLATVAYEWAKGTSFGEIVKHHEIQEGTIVRSILRLDELLRKMKTVATVIGDQKLQEKMEATSEKIRRDIIFSKSLYLA